MPDHICPWWIGFLLANPLRKLFYKPEDLFGRYVYPGDKVLDVGCAMGYFSLPLAETVGEEGKVFCVDVQEKMIKTLEKRAKKAGLHNRMVFRVCRPDSLGLKRQKGEFSFALAFAVVHEVPHPRSLFTEIFDLMDHDGKFLIAEPKGHVTINDFERTLDEAIKAGFEPLDELAISRSYGAVLQKP